MISNHQAEKTGNIGVAERYAEIVDPMKKQLEDHIASLENSDPNISFHSGTVIKISSIIKVVLDRLFAMVQNSVAVTNSCFLKQGVI